MLQKISASSRLAALAVLAILGAACEAATPPSTPTALVVTSAPPATAPVGTPVGVSVRVDNQSGQPMANVPVSFAVASGGGTVSTGTVNTGTGGIAALPAWTLGTVPGPNVLTVSSGSLTPVSVTVTAVAGAPATVTKIAGDNQTAAAGTAVPVRPAVRVTDAFNNLVANATVTFAVTGGSGTVTGGAATTNAAGEATVGSWTLGGTIGANTLSATAGTATPVVFTATATADACAQRTVLPLGGGAIAGTLSTSDCLLVAFGTYADFYTLQLPAAGAVELRQQSPNTNILDPLVWLFGANDRIVATDDDDEITGSANTRLKAIVPAGTYTVGASSYDAAQVGPYTIAAAMVNADITGCEDAFIMKGVTTTQSLMAGDCLDPGGPWHFDIIAIYLRQGEQLIIDQTSTAIKPYLELYDPAVNLVGQDQNLAGTGSAKVTHVAAASGFYYILVSSVDPNQTGSYQLALSGTGGIAGLANSVGDPSIRDSLRNAREVMLTVRAQKGAPRRPSFVTRRR